MKLKDILIAFFRSHGVRDPLSHLAAAGDVSLDSIYLYLRQAERGIGRGENMLDPKVAGWIMHESEKVISGLERNPVREWIERKRRQGEKENP